MPLDCYRTRVVAASLGELRNAPNHVASSRRLDSNALCVWNSTMTEHKAGHGAGAGLSVLLIVDALINLLLGVLLVIFPQGLVSWLGIPATSSHFYPSMLGAIFIGITIALVIGAVGAQSRRASGLGLAGAISINLCGGGALALWLVFGNLDLPARGAAALWVLVAILVGLSVAELVRRPQGSP